ncbi:MmgE/PrpD family protein [Streptomyces anthocyanicus]|uniref:MmgE/PrpD family protein n=1 Tax=Streptomyces anthocyanicus TaxID=68174 RepID=UPI00386DD0B3|nr:MmgE/PrpD family protein [Streptomyces anthocyanicus]
MSDETLLPDPRPTLWHHARGAATAANSATLDRAAGCLAVAVADMVLSARVGRHRAAADALAGVSGACTVSGLSERADITGAALANSYLMHARLTDDSFRVAAHPGLAVVPVALAAVERAAQRRVRVADGEQLLRAVVGGYECACTLAERLLPDVSQRGWRVTSVIAPLAAAATMALVLDLSADDACAALGLAAGATGGPLGVVATEGDGWSLQPALAVQAGVSAAVAASSGLRGGAGSFAGPHGLYALFGGVSGLDPRRPERPAAIHRVTLKRFPVAMYGQSIFDAARKQRPVRGTLRHISVRLAPFAAKYGNQGEASQDSIASVEAITRAALQTLHPGVTADWDAEGLMEVIGDSALPELSARLDIELSDSRAFSLTGDGDTSRWGPDEFRRHCATLLGDTGGHLYDAAVALSRGGSVDRLFDLWRAAR